MLAAAGGPEVHPPEFSRPEDRARRERIGALTGWAPRGSLSAGLHWPGHRPDRRLHCCPRPDPGSRNGTRRRFESSSRHRIPWAVEQPFPSVLEPRPGRRPICPPRSEGPRAIPATAVPRAGGGPSPAPRSRTRSGPDRLPRGRPPSGRIHRRLSCRTGWMRGLSRSPLSRAAEAGSKGPLGNAWRAASLTSIRKHTHPSLDRVSFRYRPNLVWSRGKSPSDPSPASRAPDSRRLKELGEFSIPMDPRLTHPGNPVTG